MSEWNSSILKLCDRIRGLQSRNYLKEEVESIIFDSEVLLQRILQTTTIQQHHEDSFVFLIGDLTIGMYYLKQIANIVN
jgi:hypothetical protein